MPQRTGRAWIRVGPRPRHHGEIIGNDPVEVPVTWEDKPDSTINPVGARVELSRTLVTLRHRALAVEGDTSHTTLPHRRSKPLVEAIE